MAGRKFLSLLFNKIGDIIIKTGPKEAHSMKKSWWKVPLYCIVASWICFQLEVRFLGRWTIVTLPDGSISTDSTRWLILNIVLFIIVVTIGGFFFFRKMTHKELFFSASVLVVLNIVFGLIAYKMQGMFSLYFAELTEWDNFISNLLVQVTQNVWISAVIDWILPPYIFVLFGRKASNES